MQRFKDKKDINHKTAERDNLTLLVKKYLEALSSNDCSRYLKEFLLGDENFESDQKHQDAHNGCDGCTTERLTEKRICRCMYYYNKEPVICKKCLLKSKWKNVGKIRVTEYELPTEYVLKEVGGIDMILDDIYAVEVKPPKSKETITRMIAETLTYTIDTKYKPAIAFFDGSGQEKRFNELIDEENESLKELMKYVTVFDISVEYKDGIAEYMIRRIG